jgi:hypothetical protein
LRGFLAVAQQALALHDEEHLLLAAVAVERARDLARLHHVVGVAEVLRAQQRADARGIALELPAHAEKCSSLSSSMLMTRLLMTLNL